MERVCVLQLWRISGGPLVYKFPDAITELVPSENGVLVVTASSLYLVSSDVKDLGQVFPNYPAGKVLDVATEGIVFLTYW